MAKFSADRLIRPKRGSLQLQSSYKEALIAWGLQTRSLTFTEYNTLVSNEKDWWVKKCSLRELSGTLFGAPTYEDFINRNLRVSETEVARVAAARLVQDSLKLTKPYGDVETTAKHIMKASRIIRAVGQPESRINQTLAYVLGRKETAYQWKLLLGKNHSHAERMMIFLKRNRESNIDAFLVQLDSYCDFLIEQFYAKLKPLNRYPNYGSALKDHTLIAALPLTISCFQQLHSLRLESTTAHPRSQKTGQNTRRLKHRDYYRIRKELILAFDEFEANVVP